MSVTTKRGWAVIHNGNPDSPLIKYLNDFIKKNKTNGHPLQGDRMDHYYGIDKDDDVFCSSRIGDDIDLLSLSRFKELFGIEEHKNRPISFQTVDIAVLDRKSPEVRVLLGKREHEDAYRFIGGFVDVEDNSLEEAANRELGEECKGIETTAGSCVYIRSFRVDDPRPQYKTNKIMTALFCCEYISGEPVAGDDIHEVKWFDLRGDIPLVKEHEPLLNALRNF